MSLIIVIAADLIASSFSAGLVAPDLSNSFAAFDIANAISADAPPPATSPEEWRAWAAAAAPMRSGL